MDNGLPSSRSKPAEQVDINSLILDYVREKINKSDMKSKINFDSQNWAEIIEAKLKIRNKPAVYFEETDGSSNASANSAVQRKPNSYVLFSSVFTNNTTETQINQLRSERRTTSVCRLVLSKCVTKAGSLNLQIAPPNTMIQATGGFSKECSLTQEGEKVMEEELVWSLDTQVVVPAGYETKADLLITEEQYKGYFRIETIFEGAITVVIKDKNGSKISAVVISDLKNVFTPQDGFQPVKGLQGAVAFTNEGECLCSYGINQRVELNQRKIPQ